MRKVLVSSALMLLMLTWAASAQLVDSSRIKKKTDGGIAGDSANAVMVKVPRATTAPSSPSTGNLWCDTNFTPCQPKIYNGSTWEAYVDASLPIQNDFSSFPSTPSDGQVFVTRNPPELCFYDATNTKWYCFAAPGSQQGANVVDNFTGSTITAPASALTLADNATAGNATAGAKSCKVTFANSTGGETTMSAASNTVTFTLSHSFDFTSIPTGGTGTTQRRIYCSKAGAAATGPWYWIHTVNDNTTTSVTAFAGLADANLVRHGPKSNYSAPLNARWTVVNHTTATTSGGCGSTGSAMACSQSNAGILNGGTSDTTVRSILDISSYSSGDYTIQYRVDLVNVTADTGDGNLQDPCVGTVRVGSADADKVFAAFFGHTGTQDWTTPMSAANPLPFAVESRTAVAGSRAQVQAQAPWPRTTSFVWVRWVKKGNFGNWFASANGRDWTPGKSSQVVTENGVSFDLSSANPTQFEIELYHGISGGGYYYIEVSNFTLTVN